MRPGSPGPLDFCVPAPSRIIDTSTLADLADARREAAERGDARAVRAITLAERAAANANAGDLDPAREGLTAALHAAEPHPDARLLFLAFQFAFRIDDLAGAEKIVRRRIALADPDSAGAARAHGNLGLVLHACNDFDAAAAAFAEAIRIDRAIGDERGLARDLGNSALVPEGRGDLERAETLYREALAIAERIGAFEIQATKLANLGDIALQRGRRDEARDLYTRSLAAMDRLEEAKWRDEVAEKLAGLG